MNKYLLTILITCVTCVYACAQKDQKDFKQPDLQVANSAFFDPTRPDKEQSNYKFGVEYRLEVGYIQNNQRTSNLTYPDMYLHGARIGANVTFLLPLNFSIQAGVLYSLGYGVSQQHWRSMDAPTVQTEYISHRILEHNLVIPVRAFYTVPLWKKLNLFFYGGPQLQIGLAQTDNMELHLSTKAKAWLEEKGVYTEPYDRLAKGEIYRTNIQLGVGGGFEWDRYRIQAGYDFGLNNLVKNKQVSNQNLTEWGWYTSFCYKF